MGDTGVRFDKEWRSKVTRAESGLLSSPKGATCLGKRHFGGWTRENEKHKVLELPKPLPTAGLLSVPLPFLWGLLLYEALTALGELLATGSPFS